MPAMVARRDAMVRAPTGSGKTLSYLVPIIQDLATQVPIEVKELSRRLCPLPTLTKLAAVCLSSAKGMGRKGFVDGLSLK